MAMAAFRRSCAGFSAMPADRLLGPGGQAGRAGDWQTICAASARVAAGDGPARAFFETWFRPIRVISETKPGGFFTGYFEPTLRGARTRGGAFAVPLYRRPPDLGDTRVRPFLDRAAIDKGALAGKGLELLWADDAIDVFFLHVQGSGRIVMADGTTVRLGYAGDNGHRYVPIGRILVERNVLKAEEVSLQSIREWLRANPSAATQVMQSNPRYIFFRVFEGEGPVGSAGVPLTPGRSLAVDPAHAPMGIPVWIDTTWPGPGDRPLRRLMIAQDTGAAIKGPGRGDVFWGAGAQAEEWAGAMKQPGLAVLLVPTAALPGP